MAKSRRTSRRRTRPATPWGTVAGLLTACFVTLVGIAGGLEPEIIFVRSLISGLLLGVSVSFGTSVIQLVNIESKASRK